MRAVFNRNSVYVTQSCMNVNRGRQCVFSSRFDAWPTNHHRNMSQGVVDRKTWLSPNVKFAKIMTVIGANNDRCFFSVRRGINCIKQLAKPMINHREFCSVRGSKRTTFFLSEQSILDSINHVRRPNHPWTFLGQVSLAAIHRCPGLGSVERFVRIELVNNKQRAIMMASVTAHPLHRGLHRSRTRKICFGLKPRARILILEVTASGLINWQSWCTNPRRVGPSFPGVVLVPTNIFPSIKIDVIILATTFEKMGVIRYQHRRHTRLTKGECNRVLPNFNRAPRAPWEVQ